MFKHTREELEHGPCQFICLAPLFSILGKPRQGAEFGFLFRPNFSLEATFGADVGFACTIGTVVVQGTEGTCACWVGNEALLTHLHRAFRTFLEYRRALWSIISQRTGVVAEIGATALPLYWMSRIAGERKRFGDWIGMGARQGGPDSN